MGVNFTDFRAFSALTCIERLRYVRGKQMWIFHNLEIKKLVPEHAKNLYLDTSLKKIRIRMDMDH
jgi:hypothetical protein